MHVRIVGHYGMAVFSVLSINRADRRLLILWMLGIMAFVFIDGQRRGEYGVCLIKPRINYCFMGIRQPIMLYGLSEDM